MELSSNYVSIQGAGVGEKVAHLFSWLLFRASFFVWRPLTGSGTADCRVMRVMNSSRSR